MKETTIGANLARPIAEHAANSPNDIAISTVGRDWTYREVATTVSGLAQKLLTSNRSGRIGILGSRSATACLGILAAAWSGITYVPLSLKLPEERLIQLLQTLDLDALVVDQRGATLLSRKILDYAPSFIVLSDDATLPEQTGQHSMVRLSLIANTEPTEPLPLSDSAIAYIEFTSGTTGMPKGVMVPIAAVNNYLNVMQQWFPLTRDDRVAETCDITFDLSVHNMFLAWRAGASLQIMTPMQMLAPARFIRERKITSWLSVPSIIALMRKAKTLGPGTLPSLRLSFFCGEPLPVRAAQAWAEAAPNSIVENIYGPTEATVACLRQPVKCPVLVTPNRDVVAIGKPYPGMLAAILDQNGHAVPPGTPGEIALSGIQLASGYFQQPELTNSRFPTIDGRRWYLTGDMGVEDEHGVFHHLGRLDNQIKILGNRVELEEVEMHLRAVSGSDHVAAIAWPISHGSADGLITFVVGPQSTAEDIRAMMKTKVAAYMVPNEVYITDALPLNGNGKVDRRALTQMLEEVI
ncbi:hypothetical protein CU102_14340 [Phyllobacterium brassicacearum]|uniref:D-alanine--poly(Phosphoribitol) ligase n=1 Tax=Phyllobacterium brassicacearum TaxID=314235 RepID=A0A2P7BNT1_9HYPH|nr:AMP-binding protein [Phyllobacterium brassicacearum]PSH68110.1 hypothetical protein CU102_14340 [Phyllobacterium brassicacearum]TDQ29670.1 amino acid adenylation domain-containing protein [Phyllobacterium brassicacearum]